MASRAATAPRPPSKASRAPQPAYVLHRHDWSESSLVLELFTRDQGRIAVVAKGAKRPYSQLRGVLLPFQRLLVLTGTPARTKASEATAPEVQTLRSAEWAGGAAMPGSSALLTAFYLNELIIKGLARGDPHATLFDAYAETLGAVSDADDAGVQAALRAFELLLLRELGVLPQLDVVTLTQLPVQPGARYLLRAEAGLLPALPERPADTGTQAQDALPSATLAALQAALDANDLAGLRQATRPALTALRIQLRGLLHHLFGTDRLRTRQVMLEAQRLTAAVTPSVHPS